MSRDPLAIAVVIFDQAPIFETSVPISVFGMDRSASGAPKFRLLPVAGEPGPLTTTAGLVLDAPHGLEALAEAAVIVLPSWRDICEKPPEETLTAIRAAHADGAIIVSFCLGGFVLAAAGLLDDRKAATHWFYAPSLAAMYPRVSVDPDILFIDDGDIVTGAGTGAALDACLHLVTRLWGAKASAAIARRMAMPPRRRGDLPQFADGALPVPKPEAELADVMAYAVEHIAEPVDVDDLARRAMMSRRTFDRRFRGVAGVSALRWLLYQRVLLSQRLLEESELSIDDIARRAGFRNGITLRRHFRRQVGINPLRYRMKFRPRAQTTSEATEAQHV
ncbi:GlxA family transcriptional regulator [Mycobacterium montefiorense]|uniref:AraC family transcriptional regulator n=1 Tax=Mycobacterium montefiorense TaxID=154654 RepID=A0AA37PQE8_9MYCO|nr:helix-turn-helix domain-containing protein [Mycobacterium montefiorense]GBG40365.1 AraC family transcriptional regulator [Mycobacterium montefiorense]GKU36272.1 AraC family transcriptional regulator [Mycobacterium montefiorense]GKU42841.1 AraC family transcriptional regulator [Mycobacterium montefiorense]GKU46472.1 AraC family transcriptional regulator [Mycobacterium montefiorense]GKU53647.1 AraC family transcriptional regulator [Mycobacterium montefiorense]